MRRIILTVENLKKPISAALSTYSFEKVADLTKDEFEDVLANVL